MCSVMKQRGDYLKTLCLRCFSMEYTWSVCRDLAGGFFSTDVFWNLWFILLFTQWTNLLLLLITHFLAGIQHVYNFFFFFFYTLISFNLLLIIAVSISFRKIEYSLQLTDTLKGGHLWLATTFFFTGRILVKVS